MAAAALLDTELRYVDAEGTAVVTSLGAVAEDRLSGALPVRRISSYAGQRHYPGLFWSATTGGHIPYESRLELDRLWLADFDPGTSSIAAQPMWLSGRDGSEIRRHAPDLLLRDRHGLAVVDVKPAEFASRPLVAAVFDWTGRLCQARGWRYEVWSGGDPIVLANIRALAVGRRAAYLDSDVVQALRATCLGPMPLSQAWAAADGAAGEAVRLAAMSLLWSGEWTTDMTAPLSGQSVVTPRVLAA